ncbi:phage antirepressor KilAC domain-containing protein [Oceanobacillus sp. FSL H7-0719]|uniref:phage antirepressor KilAC domain-containing protein n=1 Tax=Oceanobacillus sp. FSL H7-0719 TaxID=2954507 RepID=UPI00325538AA
MNQLTKMFDDQNLTIIENEGEPKFLLKDLCSILGLGHVATVRRRLEEDVVSKHPLKTVGGTQQATFVNEDGLYDVILDSRKPEAKKFRKWITSDVIPSIRKHGAYMTPETIEQALLNPDTIIKLATNLKEEQTKRIAAEKTIEKQQPLVTFAETCMTSEKSLLVRELAKLCTKQGIVTGEKRLWQTLRDWGLVFKNKNEPYQEYVERGYFEVSQGVKETSKGSFTWLTMRVKPKGQVYIINRLKKENEQLKAVK